MLLVSARSSWTRCSAPNLRRLAATATKSQTATPAADLVGQLEHDANRILRVVQKRVEERERLLKEEMVIVIVLSPKSILMSRSVYQSMSAGGSSEQIQRARALKESEALYDAWKQYTSTREVRVPRRIAIHWNFNLPSLSEKRLRSWTIPILKSGPWPSKSAPRSPRYFPTTWHIPSLPFYGLLRPQNSSRP